MAQFDVEDFETLLQDLICDHHLDAAGHAGSVVGVGELAWQRHSDRRKQQGHTRWEANRRDPLLILQSEHLLQSAHWRRGYAASRATQMVNLELLALAPRHPAHG